MEVAIYEIVETPGKAKVYPLEGDAPLKNQDEAKVVLSRLRAEARAEGKKVDFVVKRLNDNGIGGPSGSSQGTSIRLSEENRRKVAKFCGRMMMETGDPISMGDAVARLVDIADAAADTGLIGFDGIVNDEAVTALARTIRRAQKEAEANA